MAGRVTALVPLATVVQLVLESVDELHFFRNILASGGVIPLTSGKRLRASVACNDRTASRLLLTSGVAAGAPANNRWGYTAYIQQFCP